MLRRSDTGAPVGGATVELRRVDGTAPQSYPVTSAGDGSFQIPNVRPGEYRLQATRAGFLASVYGQRRVGGTGVHLNITTGQSIEDVQMTITAASVIAGRVSDSQGDAMGAVEVRAMSTYYQDGKRALRIVQSVSSNDLGEFRLFGLAPGEYFLNAVAPSNNTAQRAQLLDLPGQSGPMYIFSAPDRDAPVYVPIYYPGTTDARSAAAIDLAAGATIAGIDITIAPLQTHHVRGRVPGGGAHVVLAPLDLFAGSAPSVNNVDATTGPFDIPGVAPGEYLVIARSGDLTGSVRIDVRNADVDGLQVTLGTGIVIPTHVSFDDHAPLQNDPAYEFVHLQLSPDPAIPSINGDTYVPFEDGHLGFEVMAGEGYRVRYVGPYMSAPQELRNAYIKSIRMGTRDVLNEGLQYNGEADAKIEVIIGTKPGELNGSVTGILTGRQQPAINRTVVLVPDGAARRRSDAYRIATTDQSGRFQMQLIPPGDYSLFAWDDVEPGAWQDPEFLKLYEERGTRIHIDEGSKPTVALSLIPSQ